MRAFKAASRSSPSLLGLLWPFVAGMIVMLAIGIVSLNLLMSLRSAAYGETLWSRFQKDSTYQLAYYAHTGDARALARFDEAFAGFRRFSDARKSFQAEPPRYDRVMAAFTSTSLPEREAKSVIWLHRYFGSTPQIVELLRIWGQAEEFADRLGPLRDELVALHGSPASAPDVARRSALAAQINRIDVETAPRALAFRELLADSSGKVYGLLVATELLVALVLVLAVAARTARTVRAQRSAEAALADERQRAAVTLASIGDAVLSVDALGRVTYLNDAARRLTQLRHDDPLLQPLDDVVRIVHTHSGQRQELMPAALLRGHLPTQSSDVDQLLVRADGSSVPVSWVSSALRGGDADGGAVLVLHDITREQRLIERLTWLAAHDALTQLPNRREFEARLQKALISLHRQVPRLGPRRETDARGDAHHVLMLIDLDQFKIVNDTCGHAAGDELLRLVTSAVLRHLRERDTLARMGGDEFGLLLTDCSPEHGERKGEEIRQVIAGVAMDWAGRRFITTASIGLVHLGEDDHDLATVLSAADVACYTAKDHGRNRVEIYQHDDPRMSLRFGEMAWAQRLRSALDADRFCLHAQRIVGLRPESAAQERYELLVRMWDEQGLLVPPGLFIPAAERFGMMGQIDRWVVRRALEVIGHKLRHGECDPAAVFSLNLSGATFTDSSFLPELLDWFAATGVPFANVCFEITETHAVANLAEAVRFITELRARGSSFALDDFGAGMSSFAYLKQLPIDLLKIDGSLVKGMVDNGIDRAMVETIHRLAQSMGLRSVGEFAETEAVVQALAACGADYAQGYAIDRPQPFVFAASGTGADPAEIPRPRSTEPAGS